MNKAQARALEDAVVWIAVMVFGGAAAAGVGLMSICAVNDIFGPQVFLVGCFLFLILFTLCHTCSLHEP